MIDYSIILAGFGGQGILSAGRIVAQAAMGEGHEVSWFPSYGPEMRGGTANCGVVISDEAIGSPIINEPDVLIALNNPSLDKFACEVKSNGFIIVDSSLVYAIPARQDVNFVPIPASALATDVGNITFATIVLLGSLGRLTGCINRDSFEEALRVVLPPRKHDMIPDELIAFDLGWNHEATLNAGPPV